MLACKRILLVPLGSLHHNNDGIRRIADLADESGATITLLGVTPPVSRIRSQPLVDTDYERILGALAERHLRSTLTHWASRLSVDLDVTVEVRTGGLASEIAAEVVEGTDDLVILAPNAANADTSLLAGIIGCCPSRVWVLREPVGNGNVLAAIDPDDDPTIVAQIIDTARAMASGRQSALHIVHAWRLFDGSMSIGDEVEMVFPIDHPFTKTCRLEALDIEGAIAAAHEKACREALGDGANQAIETLHVMEDNPTDALLGLVDRYDIDLLVMGVRGRAKESRRNAGSTFTSVLHQANCSVLAVQPPEAS